MFQKLSELILAILLSLIIIFSINLFKQEKIDCDSSFQSMYTCDYIPDKKSPGRVYFINLVFNLFLAGVYFQICRINFRTA